MDQMTETPVDVRFTELRKAEAFARYGIRGPEARALADALMGEYDQRGAELERLRAIEQRAQAEARATDETVSTTARYILGEPTSR